MAKSTDERGRLYLPKKLRDRFGDRFRIVELPTHIGLFPVDEDPLSGIQGAVGDAFQDMDIEEMESKSRQRIVQEVRKEAHDRASKGSE